MEHKPGPAARGKRRVRYAPPVAVDMSGLTAHGQNTPPPGSCQSGQAPAQPEGLCIIGSAPSTGSCTLGLAPNSCSNGSTPNQQCYSGATANQSCFAGSVPR